jgi:nucleoid-associated protein YgaU
MGWGTKKMATHFNTYQGQEPSVWPKVLITGGIAFGLGVAITVSYVAWQSQSQRMAELTQVIEGLREQNQTNMEQPVGANAKQPVLASAEQPVVMAPQAPAPQTAFAPQVETPIQPEPNAVTRAAPIDLLEVGFATLEEPTPLEPAPLIQQASVSGNSMVDQIRLLVNQSLDPALPKPQVDKAGDTTIATIVEGVNELSIAAIKGQYVFTTRGSRNKKLRVLFDHHATLQKSLEKLLSASAQSGKISINPALRDSDGRYDGAVILLDLIQRNLLNGDESESSAGVHLREQSSVLLNPVRRPAYISVAEKKKDRFYVVEKGDSLAYLALQFYGNGSDYQRIFAANRDILRSPENIRIGQRLRIPAV